MNENYIQLHHFSISLHSLPLSALYFLKHSFASLFPANLPFFDIFFRKYTLSPCHSHGFLRLFRTYLKKPKYCCQLTELHDFLDIASMNCKYMQQNHGVESIFEKSFPLSQRIDPRHLLIRLRRHEMIFKIGTPSGSFFENSFEYTNPFQVKYFI